MRTSANGEDFPRSTGHYSLEEGENITAPLKLLDVVALTEDVLEKKLLRGQVGTIVEALAPDAYEVEFCDDEGRTYASTALKTDQLMVLYYRPQIAA